MRKLCCSGLAVVLLASVGFYCLPKPERAAVSVPRDQPSVPAVGVSEPAESGSHVVKSVPAPVTAVEPIVVGATEVRDSENVMPPVTMTEPPAERMSPAPRPDAEPAMPYADNEPADHQVPRCPYTGRCPVPHISYPLPNP